MSRKRYRAQEIIHKLREAEVALAQGRSIPEVCKKLSIHVQTYYRPPAPETRQPHKSTSAALQRPCAAETLTTPSLT